MSSFRPRKPYRFSPRSRRGLRPAFLSLRVSGRVRLAGDITPGQGAMAFIR